ncbi:hypothetical protein ACO2Q8_18135 [Larkinella sp. VNQ87]|uniref:hypothetical protein n=1 Tax=Larkinella sp. VNQ87 TaxID=3400921 RepID=UPI003C012016
MEIRYQTALVVPPPYAHFFTITLRTRSEKGLPVDLTMTYTDREELEEDEIVGEGFTGDDDYEWSGYLPAAWQQPIENLIQKTQLKPFKEEELPENQDYFQVEIDKKGAGKQAGSPLHRAEWQFLSQELIQAVYEVSGKEKPFEATYLDIASGNRTEASLRASFGRREVRLDTRQNQQTHSVTLPWKEVRSIMETIYGVDYNPEGALVNPPRKPGRYLNLGTPEWFDLSTAVLGDEGAVRKLHQVLTRLVLPH